LVGGGDDCAAFDQRAHGIAICSAALSAPRPAFATLKGSRYGWSDQAVRTTAKS
jgi:hypothetical protein